MAPGRVVQWCLLLRSIREGFSVTLTHEFAEAFNRRDVDGLNRLLSTSQDMSEIRRGESDGPLMAQAGGPSEVGERGGVTLLATSGEGRHQDVGGDREVVFGDRGA